MAKLLWTERSNFGPGERFVSAMSFDSDRNRCVLFGGQTDIAGPPLFGDTWEWDGDYWTQVHDTGPRPRYSPSLVYDAQRKVTLLFGGAGADIPNDTWEWDGTDWTQLSDTGPSPRTTAMAFDPVRGRTVLFGGSSPGIFLADTWEFDGNVWTQMQDAGPPPRWDHSLAFDPALQRVILFGGTGENNVIFADTWAWSGTEWIQIAEFGPSPRFGAQMVSAGKGGVLLFGGRSGFDSGQVLDDTWTFDGKRWTQRQSIGPGPLNSPAMAFDSLRGRIVLFGGQIPAESPGGAPTLSQFTWEASGV